MTNDQLSALSFKLQLKMERARNSLYFVEREIPIAEARLEHFPRSLRDLFQVLLVFPLKQERDLLIKTIRELEGEFNAPVKTEAL